MISKRNIKFITELLFFVGSLLSDLSYSRSEDDLDVSILQGGKTWKKHRPSTDFAAPPPKKRKSADAKVVEV